MSIWKDTFGKTIAHRIQCANFGHKRVHTCGCPKRLAFGTVDSLAGKFKALFNNWGRTGEDTRSPVMVIRRKYGVINYLYFQFRVKLSQREHFV